MAKIYACSWSGGKDSCFAYYTAIKILGLRIKHVFTLISDITDKIHGHGIPEKLIYDQIYSILPSVAAKKFRVIKVRERFTRSRIPQEHNSKIVSYLTNLKKEGVNGVVFGDLNWGRIRWIQKVCKSASVSPCIPLFGMPEKKLMSSFLQAGFKAVIVSARPEYIDRSWLGKVIDDSFIAYIKERRKEHPKLSYCGEGGEYHSFVVDGPIFKNRIEILKKNIVKERFGYCLNVSKYKVIPKV